MKPIFEFFIKLCILSVILWLYQKQVIRIDSVRRQVVGLETSDGIAISDELA